MKHFSHFYIPKKQVILLDNSSINLNTLLKDNTISLKKDINSLIKQKELAVKKSISASNPSVDKFSKKFF